MKPEKLLKKLRPGNAGEECSCGGGKLVAVKDATGKQIGIQHETQEGEDQHLRYGASLRVRVKP